MILAGRLSERDTRKGGGKKTTLDFFNNFVKGSIRVFNYSHRIQSSGKILKTTPMPLSHLTEQLIRSKAQSSVFSKAPW